MNWVKAFNELQKKYDEKIYNKATEYFESFGEIVAPLEQKFGELLSELMQMYDDLNIDDEDKMDKAMSTYREGKLVMSQIEFEYENHRSQLAVDFKRYVGNLCKEIMMFVNSRKDAALVKKRVLMYLKHSSDKLESLLSELFYGAVWFYKEFRKHIKEMVLSNSLLDSEMDVYSETIEELSNEVKDGLDEFAIKKIFDYKEMESLAKDNGYEYKWSNGSHRIYENTQTSKIVVIPAHDLGLGLSIKIQKQIMKGTC